MSTALSYPETETFEAVPALHLVTTAPSLADGAREANRWMLGFGIPCLIASLFVAAAIGSGIAWLLGAAIASLGVAIVSLSWLAISSDTNGQ